jgi:chromosome segregation ATPase
LETEYTTGPDLEKDLEETGPRFRRDWSRACPREGFRRDQTRGRREMLRVHEPVKDNIRDKPEKNPRYEMRPRKTKLSIDLNRPVVEEEYELKNENKVETKIKPKVEGNKEMEDSKQQVETLKQQNDNMRQHIQELQQQNQTLEMQHSKLQKKYQKLQKKHQKTCMFLKEII